MPFATVASKDGVGVTHADVGGFTLAELRFPPAYVQASSEPDAPYLAIVLEGSVEKSFPRRRLRLAASGAVTMPAGEAHGATFGAAGARIVIVKSWREDAALGRLVDLQKPALSWLGWRLAAELRVDDSAAPLAAEGLALELLAAAQRDTRPCAARAPRWLRAAEELLRDRVDDAVGLGEVAQAVGVHPAHLARAFREHHGVSVGEYGRRLRIARAAEQVAGGNAPLATIAVRAGFADQSHFTRFFKRYVGVTPARYREATRR